MKHGVVIISGAANGIGKHIAMQLASSTEHLILIDIENENLHDIATICGKTCTKVSTINADVGDRETLLESLNSFLVGVNEIDIVVANAGISPTQRKDLDVADRNELIRTNFFGVDNLFSIFNVANSNNRNIRKLNKFVAVTSISTLVTTHNSAYYSASKAALSAYLKGIRLKHRNSNLKVYEIVCGFVDTRVNLGLRHASLLSIPPDVAAAKIIYAIDNQNKQVHSIPWLRNLPWYVLKFMPPNLRDLILNLFYKIIYREID